MQFRENSNDGIELHLSFEECELVFNALKHFVATCTDEDYVSEQEQVAYEMMNVLDMPDFYKVGD